MGIASWRLFRKAQAWHRRGAYGKASALYRQALAANPADHGAWLWRGLALAERGRFPEAREHAEKGIALAPRSAAGRLFLARVLYDAGRVSEAESALTGSINPQAQGPLAPNEAETALADSRRHSERREVRGLVAPGEANLALADSREHTGNRQTPGRLTRSQAESALGTGLPLARNDQARGLLALCCLRAGEIEKAQALLATPLPYSPWLLGRLLAAIEELAGKAGIPPEPPAEIGPEPAPPPSNVSPGWLARRRCKRQLRRGLVAIRAEKWEKALAAFRSAESAASGNPRVAYGLGVSLYYLGHFERARQHLLGAFDQLDEPLASDALATLGKVTLELGGASEALLLLRRAIARGAGTPENHYDLGRAALGCGRPVLARRAFERCASPQFIRQRLGEITRFTAGPPGV